MAAYRHNDPLTAVLGVIAHLRERETPRLGFTRDYVALLRGAASAAELETARERWEAALVGDMLMPYHSNAFAALGSETVILAATPELCRRTAERVLENKARWPDGYWGVTGSVCNLLRVLWPLDECTDADLIPLFGWLLVKAEGEWAWCRTWDETTLGTSGHNWWAHTFLGFWMLGTFFPEFRGMQRYRALGDDYLERELGVLFASDGWSKEGSPGYHGFAAASLYSFAHLAELNGHCLSGRIRDAMRTIADAGWRMLLPDGQHPVFGDDVRRGAYAGLQGLSHPSAVLRRDAARFSLPEAKYVAEALTPEWRPFGGVLLPDEGQNLLPAYRRLPARAPGGPDTCLPVSGYYIIRQDWTPRADCLALVAGTLGPRITSHKQADIFSFELYSRGRRLLVDNWYGTVAEERSDPKVRMWRVSTAAHNTATVDGYDQVPVLREFLYGATIIPTVDDWRSDTHYAYFSGVHEGYYHQPPQVSAVRRKVFYLRGGYWILIDRFTAVTQDAHDYTLHFHLNAPSALRDDGSLITTGAGGNVLILPVPGAAGAPRIAPNPYPVAGYENPGHLTYTRRTSGNDLFVTLLVPFLDDAVPVVTTALRDVRCDERTVSPWEITGLQIDMDGHRDVYIDQHMQWNLPWEAAGYRGSGRVFHSRASPSSMEVKG